MFAIISGIVTVAILAEVCQPADFQFIGLLICGLAMRLLLTPEGPSDPVIESIPHIPGFIPAEATGLHSCLQRWQRREFH